MGDLERATARVHNVLIFEQSVPLFVFQIQPFTMQTHAVLSGTACKAIDEAARCATFWPFFWSIGSCHKGGSSLCQLARAQAKDMSQPIVRIIPCARARHMLKVVQFE